MLQARRYAIAAGISIFAVMAMLAAASLVVLTPPAGADFTDTPPWASRQINWLADNEIAGGYPDNTFRPDLNITRAQAAYWFGNYNDAMVRKIGATNPPAGLAFEHTVYCGDQNLRAVAGGGTVNANEVFITDSAPVFSLDQGWRVRWETDSNSTVNPSNLTVSVLCIPRIIP